MRAAIVLLALSFAACSYEPLGACSSDSACSTGTHCQSGICVSCAGGTCPATSAIAAASGGTVTAYVEPYSLTASISVNFAKQTLPDGTVVTVQGHDLATLPPPPAGSTPITVIQLDTAAGVTHFAHPVKLTGSGLTALQRGSQVLIVAELRNGAWVDVANAVTANATGFASLRATPARPGVREPGIYLVYQPAPGTVGGVADYGLALIADDGTATVNGLQVVTLFDEDGFPLASPTMTIFATNSPDLDGAALTPDGSVGVLVDGANLLDFFTDIQAPRTNGLTIDISNYGGDGDSIAIMPSGDEVIVSGDSNELIVISGVLTQRPTLAATIPLPSVRDGLVISADGNAMMARGSDGLSVFSIQPVTPARGPLGGTISHIFTLSKNFTDALYPNGEDGRDGMAFSPTDSSRAVVAGEGCMLSLYTGLPGNALAPPASPTPITISNCGYIESVAVTVDGTRAVLGTDHGLMLVGGVNTGSLVQLTATAFDPTFQIGAGTGDLSAGVPTLGLTLDGSYVVALTPLSFTSSVASSGALLTIPLLANGFAPPVGVLGGVGVPYNDQVLLH